MSDVRDTIRITLGAAPAADAFALRIDIDGRDRLDTIAADTPGILRHIAPGVGADTLMRQGWIIGCLERGPLRLPVTMPCDGWVLAAAPDGLRAGYGTPLFRILRSSEAITP